MATIKDALKLIEAEVSCDQFMRPDLPEDPMHMLAKISATLGDAYRAAHCCMRSVLPASVYQKQLVEVGALVVRALVLSDGIDMTKFKPKLRTDVVTPRKEAKRGSRKRKA